MGVFTRFANCSVGSDLFYNYILAESEFSSRKEFEEKKSAMLGLIHKYLDKALEGELAHFAH